MARVIGIDLNIKFSSSSNGEVDVQLVVPSQRRCRVSSGKAFLHLWLFTNGWAIISREPARRQAPINSEGTIYASKVNGNRF